MSNFWDFARHEMIRTNPLLILFGLFCGCALSGPFGTYVGLTLIERAAFWAFFITIGYVIGGLLACYVCWRLPHYTPIRLSLIVGAAFLIVIVPVVTPLVMVGVPTGLFRSPTVAEIALSSAFFTLFIMGYVYVEQTIKQKRDARRAKEAQDALPRLAKRLQDAETSPIVRLSVNDHYVVVYLENGTEERILMRFSDAVEEMDGVAGFCTHRSHWVAQSAVSEMRRCGSKEFLILTTGEQVPISKTYRGNVVEAIAA